MDELVFKSQLKKINNLMINASNFGKWDEAKDKEIDKWWRMEVQEWRTIPKGISIIPTTWVCTHKEDDLKGAVYKARCVVQGFRQEEGKHYNKFKVLSPVTELRSIRLLTVLATEFKFVIHHLDIVSAYLNAPLPKGEEIYVKPPPGYNTREGKCWFLKKSVYGMKQSGYEWFQYLKGKLLNLGLEPSDFEETIFTMKAKSGNLFIGLYVDDLFLVAENEKALLEFKKKLEKIFDLKYFGPVSEYLGIEFRKTENGYTLSQRKFLKSLLFDFQTDNIVPRKSPVKADNDGYGSNNNPQTDEFYDTPCDDSPLLRGKAKTKYESGVGSINWAANNTRPDLAFAANYLSRKSANPTQEDYKKLIHCLGYISQTTDRELVYTRKNKNGKKGELEIEAFSDASFAPEEDVKLVTGMVIYVNRNPVMWLTKKQKNITRSTAAAELVALSVTEDRTVHMVEFIKELGFKVKSTTLYEDNQAVIACCQRKSLSHTRKLVDIAMKIIRERLVNKYYNLEYVNSELNIADMFTKALSTGSFIKMNARLFVEMPMEVKTKESKP